MGVIHLRTPLTEETVLDLRAGDRVLLSGKLLTARDAAHRRMVEALERGEALPVTLRDQVVYYVGPTPAKPGQVIGSAGPTTSGRMDRYTPRLLELGLRGMIGKGRRSDEVKAALQTYRAVYFAAVGGAAALLAKCIRSVRLLAYEDLGTEAMREMEVENMPLVVVNDAHGNDWYEQSQQAFRNG
ncbi:MAG: fumarate hydratase [Bacillus thermozeamaize]|uniref:Fumarate hydratase n=1 Tax=Bacillus thermozeamaize TaxID=230954 RepID=A0A1Y3PL70_9BACI|nr:MAG: fumarate hydratase [Bacillus thermozeamaize]